MTRISISLLLLSSALTLTACKKGGSDSAAKPSEGKAAAVKLPKVGLQIDIPGEVMVSDGMTAQSNLVNGESIGALEVDLADKPQTIDDAKAEAADFSPKNLKEEKLADGWALTYDNKGSAGANYFVRVQRAIGGKTYTCATTGSKPEQAAAVLAACKSLRP